MNFNLIAYRIAFCLIFITTLIGGIFVFIKARHDKTRTAFCFFSLILASWSFIQLQISFITNPDIALIFNYFLLMPSFLVPSGFLHFVLAITEDKNYKKLLFYAYSFSVIFIALIPYNIAISGVTKNTIYLPEPNLGFHLFSIFFTIIIIFALYKLRQAYLNSTGLNAVQLKYIFWGTLIGFTAGFSNILLPYRLIPLLHSYIYFAIPLYVLILSYAIFKYRVMDINIILKKTVIYGLLYSLSLSIFFATILLLSQWIISGNIDKKALIISLFAVAVVVAIVNPLDRTVSKLANKFLFRKKHAYQRALQEVSTGMMRIRDLDKLTAFIINIITKTVGIKSANLYLLDKPTPKLSSLFQELTQSQKPLVGEELNTVSIPIVFKGKLTGILQLDEKTSGDIYSQEDLDLFATLSAQAGLAIENAKAYDELTKTKEKLFEAEKFAAIGQLAGGIAHEIKNPLVAIKTFTEYMNQKFDDPNFREKFQRIVGSEVDRINYIVEQLVSYANPKQTTPEPTNLHAVIDETIFLIEEEAKKNGIQITKQYSPLNLLLNIDPKQLKQVLLNLFLNSIQAMAERKTGPKELSITTDKQDKSLIIKISDTGKGIPPTQLPRIFEPFFTTKESGTGLGLAMSKSIVDNYHGEVKVKSEVGVGTTFILNFPI